jgi:DNA-binding beta-propeller fold protein YncE
MTTNRTTTITGKNLFRWTVAAAFVSIVLAVTGTLHARWMIVGNDEKTTWDEQGKQLFFPGRAKDNVCLVDLAGDPLAPKIVATLPLENSVYGPPTNLAITPDEKLAFVANPMKLVEKDGQPAMVPDNKLHLIDLEGMPRHLVTLEVGPQPSGMDVSPGGKLLLITSRAQNSLSVLAIEGKAVRLLDSVEIGVPTAAVEFTPDGRRALVVQQQHNKVGILHIDGRKVTYDAREDINVGILPYNVAVAPKGDLALVANSGVTGGNDGNADTLSVIDLTARPPHVIDNVNVGDGPEGLAISPDGRLAAAVLIRGSQNSRANPATAWAAHKNGSIAILSIDGKSVRKTDEIELGGMPEGVVFSPGGTYIYVGNFLSRDVSILKARGRKVVDTGKTLKLPGQPGAMRGP